MKFNAVVGNPPFQVEGNNNGRKQPIYYMFMDSAAKLATEYSLITPARFLFDAGGTPKEWNVKMQNDENFKVVKYFENSKEVFPSAQIKGGVAITLRNQNFRYEKKRAFIAYSELEEILKKVTAKSTNFISEITSSGVPYQFSDLLKKECPDLIDAKKNSGSFCLRTNVFDKFAGKFFFKQKPSDGEIYAKIFGLKERKRTYMWIKKSYISVPDSFNGYKILLPKAFGSGKFGEPVAAPIIGRKNVGHTQSFASIGNFKTLEEAEHLAQYTQTRFFRCLLGILKITQDITPTKFQYVPIQDFSPNSDIDWSKPLSEIDALLFEKYGFSDSEKNFISEKIPKGNPRYTTL